MVSGTWDDNQTKEFVMERARRWLVQYMGVNNNVSFSVSEHGSLAGSSTAIALWYASMLGTFADHGAAIFTPWDWYPGQWEVMHLFTTCAKGIRVLSTSDSDSMVSAYSSTNTGGDSLTIVLVNRFPATAQPAQLTLSGFTPATVTDSAFELSSLPATETFTPTSNALKHHGISVSGSTISVSLPAFSVTALTLKGTSSAAVIGMPATHLAALAARGTLRCIDIRGRVVMTAPGNASPQELRKMLKTAGVGCFVVWDEKQKRGMVVNGVDKN
jgi:hypothetical protein